MNFVFDIDGTLTASGCAMDPQFKQFFQQWIRHKPVWLITGSSYPTTVSQLGSDLCESVVGVYNCAGNQLHRAGVQEYSRDFALLDSQRGFLQGLLAASAWPIRVGQHIADRGALVNFSTLGRGADSAQRELYSAWDHSVRERSRLAVLIETQYPELAAVVAGATGIDIHPRGWDKSQICADIQQMVFFGGQTQLGSDNWAIAQQAEVAHTVTDWQQTELLLRDLY